jgi:cytochrome c oxidase cbb3-type subunit III
VLAIVTVLPACDRDARGPAWRRRRRRPAHGAAAPARAGRAGRVAARGPNPFAGDSRAIAEGRRLYDWMNCSGCHFEGGGGIGPPLMDDDWIYGGRRPTQIFDSIASGRANGMPAYGDKLPPEQIWQIVAYVQSLGEGTDDRTRRGHPRSPKDER